jgi:small subunit ribosomal protein S17
MQCNDPKCPHHGHLKVRGNVLTGTVKSAKAPKTVSVERILVKYVPKYERYKKTKSRVYAHNPDCIAAKEGDFVTIGETRKLSKTKSFVVLKIEKKADAETHVATAIPEAKNIKKEKVEEKTGKKKHKENAEKTEEASEEKGLHEKKDSKNEKNAKKEKK